jgi:hypothetical protein
LQATQAGKVEELSTQLHAVNQQHAKELKALIDKHRRQQEADTERTAKVGGWAAPPLVLLL